VDMVIDRGAFLSGDYQKVYDEIVAIKEACGDAHLKVILETGELGTYDSVRRASILAMAAGADFIKTSTGKVQPAATLPVSLVMMEAIRDFVRETGRPVGFKPAGGIRTSKQAIAYLVVLYETLGPEWIDHVKIEKRYDLFIGGRMVKAHSQKRFPTINPSNEEKLSEVVEADEVDVDRAVKAASKAFDSWSRIGASRRARYLFRISR